MPECVKTKKLENVSNLAVCVTKNDMKRAWGLVIFQRQTSYYYEVTVHVLSFKVYLWSDMCSRLKTRRDEPNERMNIKVIWPLIPVFFAAGLAGAGDFCTAGRSEFRARRT